MSSRPRAVPLSSPSLDGEDLRLVQHALASGMLASGPMVAQFEREAAARLSARDAVAVSSGTAALHLAMLAAGVTDGDLVITSPFSFIASANAVLYERGIPVFVDIDPRTLALDPAKTVEAIHTLAGRRPGWQSLLPPGVGALPPRLRAILPVHVFGRPAELAPIVEAAREHGLPVVEDACEALGAASGGVPAGRHGDVGVFGFYPNKQITAGEGGLLVTDNAEWARLFRTLRSQGRGEGSEWLRHERLGFNYRLDEMSGALALSQLRRLDALLAAREAIFRHYDARLAGLDGVAPLPPLAPSTRVSPFLYVIEVAEGVGRDRLMARLEARGVSSRPYFWPIHLQPFYIDRFGFAPGAFPRAEAAGRSLLALPMPMATGIDDVDYVCDVLVEEVSATLASGHEPRAVAG